MTIETGCFPVSWANVDKCHVIQVRMKVGKRKKKKESCVTFQVRWLMHPPANAGDVSFLVRGSDALRGNLPVCHILSPYLEPTHQEEEKKKKKPLSQQL